MQQNLPFLEHNSNDFGKSIKLCNHNQNNNIEHFDYSQRIPSYSFFFFNNLRSRM